MSTTLSAHQAARDQLSSFGGRLIGPDDNEYDEARALFNAMVDKRPALIVRCETPDEVAGVIRFAREHGLPLAVRGGGHNWGGLASADDGVVIDLSPMKSVTVDPKSATVRVGGGCLWKEVDAATQPHSLAVPTGIISTTGVAGLTLGGGHGYLTRRHGLTIDNLLSAEMVLADGTKVTASAEDNPDLFWAIRGGGGNFGVVTEFTFRAHPLETIVGGPTFWALEDSDELLAAYREWLPSAPRNVSGFFNWHTIPPGEPFPEEIHMRLVCGIVWCIDASDEEAEKAMAPFLSIAEPLMHGVGRMPIAALNGAFDGLYHPGDQWYARADFVREIPDEAIQRNREWNAKMPTFKSGSHLYPVERRGARRRAGGHGVLVPGRDLVAGVHRRRRRPGPGASAQGLDDRVLGGAPPVRRRRRLRQLHDGRGPGTREGDLRAELRPARPGEGRSTTRTTSSG